MDDGHISGYRSDSGASAMTPNKNADKLASFTAYCVANPSQRFWQALCNWSKSAYIYRQKKGNLAKHATSIYDEELDIEDTWNL